MGIKCEVRVSKNMPLSPGLLSRTVLRTKLLTIMIPVEATTVTSLKERWQIMRTKKAAHPLTYTSDGVYKVTNLIGLLAARSHDTNLHTGNLNPITLE